MKTARIHIRCTEKEKKQIERQAKKADMSVSRFLVHLSEVFRGYEV